MAVQTIVLDPPANTSTSATLPLSGGPSSSAPASQNIGIVGDRDWFRLDLRAGELYQFSVDSRLSFLDPTLALRSASGALLVANNDAGVGVKPTDPLLTFRPAASGTFYLEVGGTGTPGWDVRYVDVASSQGSGDEVAVAGDAVLQVTVTGAGYPYETGVEEWSGPDPLPGQGTGNVTEVVFDATFEGTTVAFVGTRAQTPFQVYALQDPARVVVEVTDGS